jgi:hypothetical protein
VSKADEQADREFHEAFAEAIGRPSRGQIEEWSDEDLHLHLSSGELHPHEQSLAEAELRRRERWDVPAAKALKVSYAALAASVVAIGVSIWAIVAAGS